MTVRITKTSLGNAILAAAAVGAIGLTALLAPNMLQFLKSSARGARDLSRKRIRDQLERLRKRRLVDYELRGNETYIRVTAAGRQYIRRFDFYRMKIKSPKRWDRKWRVVVFDVPETKVRARKTLSEKLESLGFYQLQKSVWVFPHECQDEIDFVINFLEIQRYALYIETDSLGHREGPTRRLFNLL